MYISNLSLQEYLHLNQDSIPRELLDKLDEFSKQFSELQEENKILERNIELAEEQLSFARDLVAQIWYLR